MTEIVYVINYAWKKYLTFSINTLLVSGTEFDNIRIFCVGNSPKKMEFKDKRIIIEKVPYFGPGNCFLGNKTYVCNSPAKRVIFLDADTLVFNPLHQIWEHKNDDIIARCASRCNNETWDQRYWNEVLGRVGANPSTPYFNSGFVVFQNNAHKRIENVWKEFMLCGKNKGIYDPERIHGKNRFAEQISLSLAVGVLRLSYSFMSKAEHAYSWEEENLNSYPKDQVKLLHIHRDHFFHNTIIKICDKLDLAQKIKFKIWCLYVREAMIKKINRMKTKIKCRIRG